MARALVSAFGAVATASRHSTTPWSGSPRWSTTRPSTRRAITHATGSAARLGQQLEDAPRSLLGGVVAAEHQLGLTEPGVHRGGLRSRRLGKQCRRGLELDRDCSKCPAAHRKRPRRSWPHAMPRGGGP